jgi:hypothetical protein
VFFVKNCGWEHCLLYQKLLGLAAKSGPKHFQNELVVIDPVAQQDPILLSLAQPDPKHFKRAGSGSLTRPVDLGSGWAAGPNILGSGCAGISKDIIICIINILNFISINIKNSIIYVINIIILL